MGAPAVVSGDQVTGNCPTHMVPNPSGSPTPAGPLPFSAPLLTGLVPTVLIGGKPAAVQGSGGINTPPHVGLHPSDPFLAPPAQRGQVLAGSTTVYFGGRPAAYSGCQVGTCTVPGQVAGSAATVLVGQ
ncbi:MAG TPA: PAAR domain-containing protein [Micromonosporaceae bacterium]|nr:PAAR domain-containing protein [Micromonosporaceae bacterium]